MSVPNNDRPLLLDGEFVSYYPALGVALGSVEDAVLVQHLWFRRDRATGETEMPTAALAEQVGMRLRTVERRISGLVSAGILSKRRKSAYDATSVWTVHHDRIGVSAGQPESATLAVSRSPIRGIESATLAGSESATLAVSIPKEQEEQPPTPELVDSPATRDDQQNPPTPASGGACTRHPNSDGINCRGCGTTNRQRERSASQEALALKRQQDREALERARASKPDPETTMRGAARVRESLQAARAARPETPAASQRTRGPVSA